MVPKPVISRGTLRKFVCKKKIQNNQVIVYRSTSYMYMCIYIYIYTYLSRCIYVVIDRSDKLASLDAAVIDRNILLCYK